MKIALMYSGLPRHILDMHKNHMSHIFNVSAEVDVYFHFWDIWGFTEYGCGHTITHRNSQIVTEDYKQKICSLLNPKKYVFEEFEYAEEKLNRIVNTCETRAIKNPQEFTGNPRSYVFQFYSINKTFSLIEDSYDIVVRLRSDIKFTPVRNHTQIFHIDDFVHTYSGYCYNDMNDQMAYGSMKTMKTYTDTFNKLEQLTTVHPESLLFEHLVNSRVHIEKDWDIHYIIVR